MRKLSRATQTARNGGVLSPRTLDDELHLRGLRSTPARRLILASLRSSPDHPSADDLVASLAESGHPTGVATVYQNLERLVGAGLVVRFVDPRGRYRFDADRSHHHHLMCTRCGRIANIDTDAEGSECVGRVTTEVTLESKDWLIEDMHLEVLGICPACRKL